MTRRVPGKIAGKAIGHIFKKTATIAYPKGELKIDANYRGKLAFDPTNCIGCKLCVRDCPASAIFIENEGTKEDKRFVCTLNLANCIFCGQCADSCKKNCLTLSNNVELSSLNKQDLQKIRL